MATELAVTTDRIQSFFNDLESQKTVLSSCTQLFAALTSRFASHNESLSQKLQTLDSKFKSLDSDAHRTLVSLSLRENSIPERESDAVSRIEGMKETALAEFEKDPEKSGTALSDTMRSLSRRMDASRLLRYIISRRKESGQVRSEMPAAVAEGVDPARLVLDALEEFLGDKREGVGVTDKRWACGLLVQGLFPEGFEGGAQHGARFARKVVERAAGVLESWREGDGVVGSTEAVMFLQMVMGFGFTSRFDGEYLRKLVVEYPARRDMAKLASVIGFGENMGGIIDELVKNGKEIEAVYFSRESRLTERYPPVSLLKSYLKNCKKNAATILKDGKYSPAATEESNTMELNSIKAIIRCVEDNKLESEFPLDILRKRAAHLEETKVERKKSSAAASAKPQNKRARGARGGRGRGPPEYRAAKAAKFSNTYPSYGRRNPAPPPQHSPAARYSGPYRYPNQGVYEVPTTPYASNYGVSHPQTAPSIPQQHYTLSVDNVGAAGFRSSGSYGSQTNYGAYDYGSGVPPAYQPSS